MARIVQGPLNRALVVEDPHPSLDALLQEAGVDVVRLPGGAPETGELIAALQTHRSQVLFKRSRVPVSRALLEACPDLMAVQLCSIGDDSVDKAACADHGVLVFNDPISNGRSVVELAIGHLIALSRRLYETDLDTRAGGWDKSATERFEIRGKVLGVLGLGNIGRATARAAERMGMRIRFYDTREVSREVGRELGWEGCATLEELFAGSDAVTLHLSAQDIHGRSNAGLITRDLLMRLGADRPKDSPRLLLNLSRGFLFDPEDLLAAIRHGAVGRAAVDVYPDEPRGKEPWRNPYVDEPRVAVTPHIGASTQEAQPRIATRVAATFREFALYGSVRDCVFSPRTMLSLVEDALGGGALLAVAHATTRGTKRAIDEAIYQAGASNLSSVHKDFEELGLAYDLALIDRPLDEAALRRLVEEAARSTGDATAIRSIHQMVLR
jgi:D-3-phosphoglycerate dehydrogenase / 2-oxoglutarate reductase